jgi:general secretion pathway protein A
MYRAYWQLERRPFDDFADPAFYYPGEAHQGALLKLRYAVENGQPAALLAGAPGVGKTLLLSTLLARLPERFAPRVQLVFPQMPPEQLLAYLAAELEASPASEATATIEQSVRRIEHTLAENARAGRHTVVMIDEAHLLADVGSLELMRLLLNFAGPAGVGLTLLLVGQPAILPQLDRLPSLEERLGVKCLLRPLTCDETAGYVTHRLAAAGAQRAIFEDEALEALYHLSRGVPRRINRLADLALLIGFAEERTTIAASQIEAVSEELVTVAPE